jgi:hypothetical protein
MLMSFSFSASAEVQPNENSVHPLQYKWIKDDTSTATQYFGDARYVKVINYDAASAYDPPKFYISFSVRDNPNDDSTSRFIALLDVYCEEKKIFLRTLQRKDKNGRWDRTDFRGGSEYILSEKEDSGYYLKALCI